LLQAGDALAAIEQKDKKNKQKPKKMTIFEKLNLLERVHSLINRKATGSPEQLAQKIGYSKRQTLRLVADLKALGMPIRYDRERYTYYYEEKVAFKIQVLIETEDEKNIKGGKNSIFLPPTPFFGIEQEYLCD